MSIHLSFIKAHLQGIISYIFWLYMLFVRQGSRNLYGVVETPGQKVDDILVIEVRPRELVVS